MAFITSFQAKVIIGREFWFFSFFFFLILLKLGLLKNKMNHSTYQLSAYTRDTEGDWLKVKPEVAANPLVNLNSVCVGRGRVVPEFFGESVIKLNNCRSQKIRQYNLH